MRSDARRRTALFPDSRMARHFVGVYRASFPMTWSLFGLPHPRVARTRAENSQMSWLSAGPEVDFRKTDYTQFQPNAFFDSDAVIIASRFLWRF